MGIVTALQHITHYSYDKAVKLGPQTVRLRPAPHNRSRIQSYSLKVEPTGHFLNWQQDPFGNYMARLVFPKKTKHLKVVVDLVTEIRIFNPFDFFLEEYAEKFPFPYDNLLKEELTPYLEIKERGPHLMKFVEDSAPSGSVGMINYLFDTNKRLYEKLRYLIRLEPGVQGCEETLQLGSGSCRDMAWLLCQLLRHHGLATRFVSGYLIQLKPDVKPLDGPEGPKEDFIDLHAWTEVYLPGAGWVGLDPTSGLFAGEGHIPLCCTPTPLSAAPISGSLEECRSTFAHDMRVTRLSEERRPTKPYSDEEWKKIDELGKRVDSALRKSSVRLTMGGEPTFVSLDDQESNEWHFTALGKTKKRLGEELLVSMEKRFAEGGLLQFTQGKWYPGEEIPRWSMNCYWRRDGEKLWNDKRMLSRPSLPHTYTNREAEKFIHQLCMALAIDSSSVANAYEDRAYEEWKKSSLPIDEEDSLEARAKKRGRKKSHDDDDKTVAEPAGYVLPLLFSRTRRRWVSSKWKFRRGELFLTPGDSPIGFRLPLSSLPKQKRGRDDYFKELPPKKQRGPLPRRSELLELVESRALREEGRQGGESERGGIVRSALCIECRGGKLYLFLPPLQRIAHFFELITAIEWVSSTLDLPIQIEGYPPPKDLRVNSFSITPDPGVLEVNIHPSSNWSELKEVIFSLYDEAKKVRLTAEKFNLDGKRTGTGGGNHIVIGGAYPEESPFLRKPDLLRSLVTFWQNHPSLSYLFASQYIGPTSQAPRIDEARHDSLYELEIAFNSLPKRGKISPQTVDRLFRNVLVDLTGNTHRAEFCIDKLYNPTSASGMLGLLELRGFEMAPHPQMNLLQALLVRAAIAYFWNTPYAKKLIQWGTRLHDKFLLPQYIFEDLKDVLYFFKVGGFSFNQSWFEPFVDFRFPVYGRVNIGAISLELRMALEPWPVLGEELFQGSVSRSVDTSVERLQVKVCGIIEGRHLVTCNRRVLPLTPCEERGAFIAGVRYKAWKPHSSMHPTLPVHTPLVFDIIDTHNKRSIGGCTYHVSHPGGRSYDRAPINDHEADGRRISRFESMGHTPGEIAIPKQESNPDFPFTLDLRTTP